MKTIYLILSLLIGSISMPTFPTITPISSSISYEITPPPVEKKKRKARKKKNYQKAKYKNKKYRQKRKAHQHPNREQLSRRSIVFYILSGVFGLLFIFFLVCLIALVAGGGWGLWIFAIIVGFLLGILALASLVWSILFLVFAKRNRKKRQKTTLKKEESTLRKEVRNLSEREQQHYIKLNDELTAARVQKNNFDRNIRKKRAEGMTHSELKAELDNLNYKISELEREIRALQTKSKKTR